MVPRWASTEVTELVAHPDRVACVSIRSNEVITDRLALDYNPLLLEIYIFEWRLADATEYGLYNFYLFCYVQYLVLLLGTLFSVLSTQNYN